MGCSSCWICSTCWATLSTDETDKRSCAKETCIKRWGATLLFLPLSFYLWPATDLLTSARPENGRKTRQASTIINLSEATRQQRVLGWSYLDFSFPPWSRFESLKTSQKGLFAKKKQPQKLPYTRGVCFDNPVAVKWFSVLKLCARWQSKSFIWFTDLFDKYWLIIL